MAVKNIVGKGQGAPELHFIGDKWGGKGTYSQSNPKGYFFGQHASKLRQYVMNSLSGAQGNLLKLMWYLMDTDEGFRLAEQNVLNETGMQHAKYIQARAILTEIGWLARDPSFPDKLAINYELLWNQANMAPELRRDIAQEIDAAKIRLGYKK